MPILSSSLFPLVTTGSFSILCVCFLFVIFASFLYVLDPHISNIIQYLSLSVWLSSLSPPSQSMLLQMATFHSFYGWIIFHYVYIIVHFLKNWSIPWVEGVVRELGMDTYTLLYLNKDLLHSTENSAPCYVAAWMGGGLGGGWKHVYVWLSPFSVYLKPFYFFFLPYHSG